MRASSEPEGQKPAGVPAPEAAGRKDRLNRWLGGVVRILGENPRLTLEKGPGGVWAALLAAVVVMFTFLTFPPEVTKSDPDTSLSAVLNYASVHGLQFGSQVVSTYGPLGFLVFPHYSSYAPSLRMAADVVVSFTVAAGVCLVGWRLRLFWRLVFLGVFVWEAANVWLRTDLALLTGLFCWGLLCLTESGRRSVVCAMVFGVLAAFSGLAKVSLLLLGTAGMVLVLAGLFFATRLSRTSKTGERRLPAAAMAILAVLGVFVASFVGGWLAAGQSISHLGVFMARALEVVRSYNEALGVESLRLVNLLGIVTVVLAFGTWLWGSASAFERGERRVWWRRLLLCGWGCLFLFESWKHGFVRGDTLHASIFLAFVPVVLLASNIVPAEPRRARAWGQLVGLATVAVPLLTLQVFMFSPLPGSLLQPCALLRLNLRRLVWPEEFSRLATEAAEAAETERQLPRCRQIIGDAAVDVFGQNQVYALENHLRYRPRPVFQSYNACNAGLMRLNEGFFFSTAAPQYWLFQLEPLDRKFAPLEDAWLLRDLLVNAEPVASEKDFLLLRKTSNERPRLRLLEEGSVEPGQPLDLRRWTNGPLWLELDLEPSLTGLLRQLVFRPPTIRLTAWREPDKGVLYRHQAAASMLAAGFVASPLLERTADMEAACAGKPVAAPGAYSVEVGEGARYWDKEVRFRVYRVEGGGRSGQSRALREAESHPSGPTISRPPAIGSRPFILFRKQRWRPEMEEAGSLNDWAAYGLFVLLPAVTGAALMVFFKRIRSSGRPASWGRLVAGNALITLFLVSLVLLAGESWFRFVYDTTDSLAYTKVTEAWVQRHWRVNSAGCRDDVDYSPRLQPGKRRISFIGDSFTAGHGIKNVDDRMANLIRQAHPEVQVHVLANIGLDTGAEIKLLNRLFALGCQVDRVVLVYCLNDIGDLAPEQVEASTEVLAKVTREGWLVRHSYWLNLLYERYQVWRYPYARNYSAYIGKMYAGPLWAKQQERLRRFRDLVESHGGHLAVVTFPLFHALGPAYPYRSVHEELDRFWRQLGVPHLDLLPVYAGIPGKELVVNPYDAHPNEYANRLAAKAVRKFLFTNWPPPVRLSEPTLPN